MYKSALSPKMIYTRVDSITHSKNDDNTVILVKRFNNITNAYAGLTF